jgi:uncharacterized protein (DUF1015 family)
MLLVLQAPFNFMNKTQGIKMHHRNELNETNLKKPKKNLKQVQLEQHETKLNQKIEELVEREIFKYVNSGW